MMFDRFRLRPVPRPTEEQARLTDVMPAVRRYFVRRAGATEADDLTQEVYARLAGLAPDTEIEHASAYVFQVAAHVFADKLRRDRRRHDAHHVPLEEELHPVEVSSPESVLLQRDMLRAVAGVIEELPPRVRDAFVLHRFEEMTYDAIARLLGCSVSSVEKYIARASKHVAARMKELNA
jgi:RNA polymerase sigma-70 factor (ECF subfamily)